MRIKRSYSIDCNGRSSRSNPQIEMKSLNRLRSVIRSDVETGKMAEVFVKSEHEQNMREFFKLMDKDNDGVVSARALIDGLHYLEPKLEKHFLSQKKYGENSDATLNLEEFIQLSVYRINAFQRMVSKYCEIVVPSHTHTDDPIDAFYEDNMSCWPPPLTMLTFSILQLIFYFIPECSSELQYNPKHRIQFWRFITYMFLHSNALHLGGNLVMQICFGIPLELVNQWWRVTLIYLSGVLAGSIGQSITSSRNLEGASGGVYALIVAHVATVILNWKELYHPSFQLTFFLIYCGADFYYSCVEYLSEHRDVSHFCHLGGAIAGLLIGIGVLCNFKQRPWKRKLWFGSVAIFVLLISIGVFINIFFFDSFVTIPQPIIASDDSTSTIMPDHSLLNTTISDDT